jgi:hypothetical protein
MQANFNTHSLSISPLLYPRRLEYANSEKSETAHCSIRPLGLTNTVTNPQTPPNKIMIDSSALQQAPHKPGIQFPADLTSSPPSSAERDEQDTNKGQEWQIRVSLQ